jgi:L-aminopeptidase/D-esterase-like protein
VIVGALVAVNPLGSVTVGGSRHFWAAPFERDGEFGGHGVLHPWPAGALDIRLKQTSATAASTQNTTIAIVATNARLTKRDAHRVAVMAQTGLARAIYPVHTPLDGDVVFAVSTGEVGSEITLAGLAELGAVAANTLARAVALGVYHAGPVPPVWTGPPSYRSLYGG